MTITQPNYSLLQGDQSPNSDPMVRGFLPLSLLGLDFLSSDHLHHLSVQTQTDHSQQAEAFPVLVQRGAGEGETEPDTREFVHQQLYAGRLWQRLRTLVL